jgi:hypothetical protein
MPADRGRRGRRGDVQPVPDAVAVGSATDLNAGLSDVDKQINQLIELAG